MLGQQIRRETADRLDLRHLDHLATLTVVTMARSTMVIVTMSTIMVHGDCGNVNQSDHGNFNRGMSCWCHSCLPW